MANLVLLFAHSFVINSRVLYRFFRWILIQLFRLWVNIPFYGMEKFMKLYERHLSGYPDENVREYETAHRVIAREAASEGMVLLKNDNNLLPLEQGTKLAVYGPGVVRMIKGGTGSGDVNQREVVGICEGLRSAGFEITNEDWINEYCEIYQENRLKWRDELLERSHKGENLFEMYAGNPMPTPKGADPVNTGTDIAIYVVSRVAGEGADRKNASADYLLSDDEKEFIDKLCKEYAHVIIALNTGGLIDLGFAEENAAIEAIIYMMQPGMEGGNAFADIISGKVNPSGKLTDTWAYKYSDYPSSATFSHNNGCVDFEQYTEGIYVGYRYFDTFSVAARYGFGFGLSYTNFKITTDKATVVYGGLNQVSVEVTLTITNTGDVAGKEVAQVYVSCPDGKLDKEFRRLCGFAKTRLLNPSESQTITVTFPIYSCASYDVEVPGYVLEAGYYGIWVGNSLGDSRLRSMLKIDKTTVLTQNEHICECKDSFDEISVSEAKREGKYKAWVEKGKSAGLEIVSVKTDGIVIENYEYGKAAEKINKSAREFVDTLSLEKLVNLATGDPGRAENSGQNLVGAGGVSVPGSAAETSRCAVEDGLGSMVLTDGPAGLRLDKGYVVSVDGAVERKAFIDVIEDGIFSELVRESKDGDVIYHQYCTAFPIGTLLAQTWNPDLISRVGEAVGEEMNIFQTALWLAPGMNIHRNPLCGRNFEYYSEDPLLTGVIAAAMTKGVQSVGGCGTTIKHFACNNEEENRTQSDSRVKERALREIYLKGFEICIKSSQPMSIMTSYNRLNGVHTANNYDLCTKVAREEWGFEGMIMTDWCTTEQKDECCASGCINAGNDLVCPGCENDHTDIKNALDTGKLTLDNLKNCIARTVNIIWQSNAYVDAVPYNDTHVDLYDFMRNK